MQSALGERFWSKVQKSDGCWVWAAARSDFGYGVFFVKMPDGSRKWSRAHRLSWEAHFGEIPVGLVVCHRCDNPPCVRPEHLFLGTKADNMKDMMSKGRHRDDPRLGEQHGCANLSDSEVVQIRSEYDAGGISQVELAAKWGTSVSSMHNIVRRKQWRHLP